MTLNQGESLAAFRNRLDVAAGKAGVTEQEDMVYQFIEGMPIHIRTHLRAQAPKTIQTCMQTAQAYLLDDNTTAVTPQVMSIAEAGPSKIEIDNMISAKMEQMLLSANRWDRPDSRRESRSPYRGRYPSRDRTYIWTSDQGRSNSRDRPYRRDDRRRSNSRDRPDSRSNRQSRQDTSRDRQYSSSSRDRQYNRRDRQDSRDQQYNRRDRQDSRDRRSSSRDLSKIAQARSPGPQGPRKSVAFRDLHCSYCGEDNHEKRDCFQMQRDTSNNSHF